MSDFTIFAQGIFHGCLKFYPNEKYLSLLRLVKFCNNCLIFFCNDSTINVLFEQGTETLVTIIVDFFNSFLKGYLIFIKYLHIFFNMDEGRCRVVIKIQNTYIYIYNIYL